MQGKLFGRPCTTNMVVVIVVAFACLHACWERSAIASTESTPEVVSNDAGRNAPPRGGSESQAGESSLRQPLPELLSESLGAISESLETEEDDRQPGQREKGWSKLVQPERLGASLQLVVTMTLVGLIPALLLMTTSYIRITIVLSLLRQAFGSQQLIPAQVTTSLAMLCTGLIMWPTWQTVYEEAILPWSQDDETQSVEQLWQQGVVPVQHFMITQIKSHGNVADVHLFLKYAGDEEPYPTSFAQVPMRVLMPAFLLSELKTAFLIGFRVYLPFLVIDLVVASITTAMGMFMLPPATVSLPLKLLLFVMADGWRYVIDMLLMSFR